MLILSNHYVLAVHSIAESSEFYTRALGFEEVFNDGNWSFVKRDNCMIMLGKCRDAMHARDLGDHSYFAYLVVDAADAFYSRCTAKNVEITSPIEDKPWKIREFGIRTPDGHRMMIGNNL